jgi:hypothetical protein
MSDQEIYGSCLCGQVAYALSSHLGIFQYCHCSRCRKFTGSAMASNLLARPKAFRWLRGADKVGTYQLETAKHFATAFCKRCGSSMPWFAQTGKVVVVPAGSLDSDPGVRPSQNIFCASDAAWYVEPGELPMHDELPLKQP